MNILVSPQIFTKDSNPTKLFSKHQSPGYSYAGIQEQSNEDKGITTGKNEYSVKTRFIRILDLALVAHFVWTFFRM